MIETPRLILRGWRDGDGSLMARHCNTHNVMRWLGPLHHPSFYDDMAARQRKLETEYGHCFWVVQRRDDGAFLGFCGLKIGDPEEEPIAGEIEIGWRLREDAWGRGYAKEAATASLDFAFETLDAPRVVALTVDENRASWGLMLRLGMTRRPDLDHHDGRYPVVLNPTIVYVLEADEWRM